MDEHIDYKELEKISERVSERINKLLESGELVIITPNHHTEQDFKQMFKKLSKKKNKFLKSLRKYYGRPYEAIEEFEYIITQFEVSGVLSENDVFNQRARFYSELKQPKETLEFLNKCRNKGFI